MKKELKIKLSIFLIGVMLATSATGVQNVQAADDVVYVDVDMSNPFSYGGGVVAECSYDEATGQLTATDAEQFLFKLPEECNTGDEVIVQIKGTCDSNGFRSWLSDDDIGCNSNIMKTSDEEGFDCSKFELTYVLNANTFSDSICIKGISYGTKIGSMIIDSLKVSVHSEEGKIYTIPDPYTPTVKQASDVDPLTLAKGNVFKTSEGEVNVDSLAVSQRFIADPTCVEYEGRLYLYGTTDEIEFDGKGNVTSNTYNTHTMSCISTSDMVNWRDEGKIDVTKLTKYAAKSWAPSIVSKEINGKTKFFLYYTTGGDGIAMLTADSPTGPWSDPLGKRLIDRDTPNCTEEQVPWLFDPGVFVDDDGTGYIYFGGNGGSSERESGAARICKLSDDMTSLAEEPHQFSPYYYFEDNEINKIGDTYYYSYSTNWSSDLSNGKDQYTGQACIAYYTADNPYMENATYHGTVFENPGNLYGHSYNNHHHMFTFKNQWYIAYHTTYLEQALYGTKKGFRSIHVDKVNVDGKKISAIPTYAGAESVGTINGAESIDATTMARSGGITTSYSESLGKMVLDKIDTGDWTMIKNVNFDQKAASEINASFASSKGIGSIEVYLDKPLQTKVATIAVDPTGGDDVYKTVSEKISGVSGTHDVYFVFRGEGYRVSAWQFGTPTVKPTATPTAKPTVKPTTKPTAAPKKPVVKSITKTIQNVVYKVTGAKSVSVTKLNKNQKKVTIPKSVKIGKKTYQVTSIGAKAFANKTKLKSIVVKSTKIKSIGKNAFKGINKKAVIKVPKKAKKSFKKLLKKKTGFSKKMKLK